MATYKIYNKTDASGTKSEIKIPYSSIEGTPTIPQITQNAVVKNTIDFALVGTTLTITQS